MTLCLPVADEDGPHYAPVLLCERPIGRARGQYLFISVPEVGKESKDATQWKRGRVMSYCATAIGNRDMDLVVADTALNKRPSP